MCSRLMPISKEFNFPHHRLFAMDRGVLGLSVLSCHTQPPRFAFLGRDGPKYFRLGEGALWPVDQLL